MYTPLNALGDGRYGSFSVADAEQTKDFFLRSWSTDAQREYNRAHRTCPACAGQGYLSLRRGKVIERDSVGCEICNGTGAVSNAAN
jgi:DnaJ-class molecular chaperone